MDKGDRTMNSNGNNKLAKYRDNLPQLSGDFFLTDGGIETTLIFHNGFELPEFAAFDVLKDDEGRQALGDYYRSYAAIAKRYGVGFILESPTWRASLDWGRKIGYSTQELVDVNQQAIEFLSEIRAAYESIYTKIVISGCIGPRDDGYSPASKMDAKEAQTYHSWQMAVLSDTEVDLVTALTMTYAEEAIGVVRAAQAVGLPVVISFTLETDGRLPDGSTLQDAIQQVDAATNYGPVYYMINCAHPTHFEDALAAGEAWTHRIRGVRANASRLSHAELDEAEALDDGNPLELGDQYHALQNLLSGLNVMGGCCGTDHRHIEEICRTCAPVAEALV
jgi:S-methylmethionine-dependent homocysteine/selenocysteine methylase